MVAAEDKTLQDYNFPLNDFKNGGMRANIRLPGGKVVSDYPIKDEDLATLAAAIRFHMQFKAE